MKRLLFIEQLAPLPVNQLSQDRNAGRSSLKRVGVEQDRFDWSHIVAEHELTFATPKDLGATVFKYIRIQMMHPCRARWSVFDPLSAINCQTTTDEGRSADFHQTYLDVLSDSNPKKCSSPVTAIT